MKKKKYIHISSGRGPVECCWVVSQVTKTFLDDIDQSLYAQVAERDRFHKMEPFILL